MARNPVIECVDFRPGWEQGLGRLFAALAEADELRFFDPHPHDPETLARIAARTGGDLYYLLVEGDDVLGYGLLRGWDEGFDVPSLGVAVHPAARSAGLGALLMQYLETMAAYRGASGVRLRVMRTNTTAVALYAGRGYHFENDPGDAGLLVGHKAIGREAP
jgi:[ribosomal protein S18]-alanine N-acetyltransferase